MPRTVEEVVNSLRYHKNDDQEVADKFEDLREAAIEFAQTIAINCEDNRETALAYTHLEETLMWAVKSIAIRMDV
jgi:hypothetical protein